MWTVSDTVLTLWSVANSLVLRCCVIWLHDVVRLVCECVYHIVWTYDSDIPYLSLKLTPLFLVAMGAAFVPMATIHRGTHLGMSWSEQIPLEFSCT